MLAQATLDLDFVGLVLRVLHTTGAATLLGGLIYMRFVLAPTAAGTAEADTLFAGRRGVWARCVAAATLLLLVSGLWNFYRTYTAVELPPAYHMAFGLKFLIALAVFAIAALLAGKTGAAQRLRQRLVLWLNVALVATLVVFVLGAVLRQVPRQAKAPQEVAAATPTLIISPQRWEPTNG